MPRERLVEQLNVGLSRKLTIVSAPAGFGKTTLLSEWIHSEGRSEACPHIAWVSLDGRDNDPVLFWTYVIVALQGIDENLGRESLRDLHTLTPLLLESILTDLINDLTKITKGCALILDDYHLINEPAIHESLSFLIDHAPPQMHLIIASRTDLPLPQGRLRARGQLVELRSTDLRFTEREVSAFLTQVMNLQLSREAIVALVRRTEGWIVGLQLAALSMQGKDPSRVASFITAFTGSHRYVLDYLVEEVLHQQPEDVQAFLLQTAILDRLTGPLCDAVVQDDLAAPAQQTLDYLHNANLFIVSLDDERRWYRYHHLFADLLKTRLAQTHPGLIPTLHRRASVWYAENGIVAEGITHALESSDVDLVEELIKQNALAMMEHGELKTTTLIRWLNALPGDTARTRPWLCVAHAWAMVYANQMNAVAPHLQDAETALVTSPPGARETRHIMGHIGAIRAYQATLQGRIHRAADLIREALDCLPAEDAMARSWATTLLMSKLRVLGKFEDAIDVAEKELAICRNFGDRQAIVTILCSLGALQRKMGQLHAAERTYREALSTSDEHARLKGRHFPVTAYAHLGLGDVLYERYELETALHHSSVAVELCERWGIAEALWNGYVNLARILLAAGDHAGALAAIQRAYRAVKELSPWIATILSAFEARVKLAQGDLATATKWLEESHLCDDDKVNFLYGRAYLHAADILIAQGRLAKVHKLLSNLIAKSQSFGTNDMTIKIMVRQAIVYQLLGQRQGALAMTKNALVAAEPEGYIRVFVEAGRPMEELLHQAAASRVTVGHVGRILRTMERPPELTTPQTGHRREIALVEPLTGREMEVLQLLALGYSNKEIASTLIIAVGTTKNHLRNIYAKLDVRSRTQAVARARDLGLL
jgi:LuxR family maltose regulon positive regulatory protein